MKAASIEPSPDSGNPPRGVAIIMVILMIAIAMTVLIALSDSTYVAMRLNSAAERRVKAEYILKSAVNVALVLIENDKNEIDDPLKDDWMKFTQGLEAPGELLGLSEPNVRVSLLIASEQGKIPLLRLKDTGTPGNPSPDAARWADVMLLLLQNLGVGQGRAAGNQPPVTPEQLVANLVDYIDTNEENFTYKNFQGSESSLPDGQKFRNEGKIESVASELSSIPGWTPDIVQSVLPFVSTADFQKVNLNSAPLQVLMALDAQVTQQAAQQIMQARDPVGGTPYTSAFATELTAQVGSAIADAIIPKVTNTGKIFEVIAKVEYGGSTYMASATINKSPKPGAGGGAGPKVESLLLY